MWTHVCIHVCIHVGRYARDQPDTCTCSHVSWCVVHHVATIVAYVATVIMYPASRCVPCHSCQRNSGAAHSPAGLRGWHDNTVAKSEGDPMDFTKGPWVRMMEDLDMSGRRGGGRGTNVSPCSRSCIGWCAWLISTRCFSCCCCFAQIHTLQPSYSSLLRRC